MGTIQFLPSQSDVPIVINCLLFRTRNIIETIEIRRFNRLENRINEFPITEGEKITFYRCVIVNRNIFFYVHTQKKKL